MKPHEILAVKEYYEPETLRILFPQLTDEEQEQLQVLQALTYNLAFWQDPFIFENAVLALNGVKPEIGFMQGSTPAQIWYAAYLVNQAFPDREYESEIKSYVRFMSNQQGVYIYPPQIFSDKENPYYAEAKKLESKNKALGDSSTAEIQAGHLATINLYIRLKQDDEKIKVAQENKDEAYYTKETPLDKSAGGGRDIDPRWAWFDTKSLYFPETNDYALSLHNQTISELYSPPNATNTTLSLWYKYETPTNGLARTILYYGWSSTIQVSSTGSTLRLTIRSGTTSSFSSALTANAWYHIALVSPVSNSGLVYVNGVEKGYVNIGNYASPTDVILGAAAIGTTTTKIKGNVNDLAVWNTILTSGEIYQLATAKFDYRQNYGNYNSSSYLQGYYLMGDGKLDSTSRIYNVLNESVYFTNGANNLQIKFETQ